MRSLKALSKVRRHGLATIGCGIAVAAVWRMKRRAAGSRKRAEEELRRAQDLAHVSRITTIRELTTVVAHDVTQPMAAAIIEAHFCLSMLEGENPQLHEAREAARRIEIDVRSALENIERIRLLVKKGAPQRTCIDVNELVREMIALSLSEARQYDISIRTELPRDPLWVMGDRAQLQLVLMNLIMNSIDAMKDAAGTRDLAIASGQAERKQTLLCVSDTGVGLPAGQPDQIFKAFFTTKPQALGMGLSISRSIVEAHGGRMWAVQRAPRGASLFVTLPAAVDPREM